ncbi:hypothetical protein WJX73_008830 [Symbiochloris irregularis]|uniref:protein-tyrosine sulfotransferase n=1 Tax=Symbiochloris irregularis TaxID=706552 RepID=A0AAW1NMI8_9CHLO
MLLVLFVGLPACRAQALGIREQQYQELDRLREAAKRHPDYQHHLELAMHLHSLDQQYPDGGTRIAEAEQAYRDAVDATSSPAAAAAVLSNLAALLLSAGRLNECLSVIDDCLKISTGAHLQQTVFFAGALFNRGKALGQLGRPEAATAAFEAAIAASRRVSPGTFTKAYASLSKFSDAHIAEMDAAAQYLQLQEGGARLAGTGGGTAGKKRRRQNKEADLVAEWQWLKDTPPIDQSWLHFALFAAYQTKGDYSTAWRYLAKANDIHRSVQQYTRDQDTKLSRAILDAFPKPHVQDSPLKPEKLDPYPLYLQGQAGHDSQVPVFVVGMPRSGSTLVEQILASHTMAFGAGEDTALAPLLPELTGVLGGGGSRTKPEPRRVAAVGAKYVAIMQEKARQRHEMEANKSSDPVSPHQPYQRIVDKMLRNAFNLGHIAIMLPAAKVLHVKRHPMDVALSCYAQPFEGRGTPWAWSLDDIAHQIQLTHDMMKHWTNILPEGRIMDVPYEALVANQEATSREILKFVGLTWESGVLKFHETVRSVQTASLGQVRQKLYTSAVGKWRRYEEQLQPVYEQLQPLIEEYEAQLQALDVAASQHVGAKDEL